MIDIFEKILEVQNRAPKYFCCSSNALCQYDNNFLELPIPYRNENCGLPSKNTRQFLYGHDFIFLRCQSKKIKDKVTDNRLFTKGAIIRIFLFGINRAIRIIVFSTI